MNEQKNADTAARPDVVLPDGRVWWWLADIPHTRIDGSETTLAVWHTGCAVCGSPVFASTPAAFGSDATKTKAFGRKHCEDHKLSRAEVTKRWVDAIKRKTRGGAR